MSSIISANPLASTTCCTSTSTAQYSSVNQTTGSPLTPFLLQKAQQKNSTEILQFLLTDFLKTEPLNVSVGLTKAESEHFFAELVRTALQDDLSYLVRDQANDNTIVAVKLGCVLHRKGKDGSDVIFAANRPENGKINKICDLLHAVESKIWQLVPSDLHILANWLVISVDSTYKRRGIAAALMEYGLDEAVKLGCQGSVAEATAINSQKMLQKLGYVRLFELLHSEWKNIDGSQVFRCADGTDRVTLDFKPLPSVQGQNRFDSQDGHNHN